MPSFESHAIVELMGHARIAGKVSEQVIAGAAMLRVDVPQTAEQTPFTKFYAPNAIYCITPVEEHIAQAAAERFQERPIQPWVLNFSAPQLVEKITVHPEDDWDEDLYDFDDEWPDDEPDDEPDYVPFDLGSDETEEAIDRLAARADAIQWAQDMAEMKPVIFDTETTGFGRDDEIVRIAIIDWDGNTLLDQLIKPSDPEKVNVVNAKTGKSAADYHGINPEMLEGAPTFPEVYPKLAKLLFGDKERIAYNAAYDDRMFNQMIDCHQDDLDNPIAISPGFTGCAMLQYAAFAGDWNDYHGNWKWHKLADACRALDIPVENEHDPVADCQMTLALVKAMAAADTQPESDPPADQPVGAASIPSADQPPATTDS